MVPPPVHELAGQGLPSYIAICDVVECICPFSASALRVMVVLTVNSTSASLEMFSIYGQAGVD